MFKIAGVKTDKEFYAKYPTEEAFMAKHGKTFKAQFGFMGAAGGAGAGAGASASASAGASAGGGAMSSMGNMSGMIGSMGGGGGGGGEAAPKKEKGAGIKGMLDPGMALFKSIKKDMVL